MDKPRHHVGTDRSTTIESRGLRPGRTVQSADRVVTVWVGLRHAVPEGSSTALCGHEPRFVWEQLAPFPGQGGSFRDICGDCRTVWNDLG